MSTIHSSPIHFIPPSAVASSAGQVITSTDNVGNSAWLNIPTPQLPPNGVQIFFSKQIGSDITGTGSYTNPFASINAAISAAGTPSTPVIITGLDGDVYDEQLVLSSSLIFINAPLSRLAYSGIGDAVTIIASGAGFPIILAQINAASGNAVVNTNSDIVVLTVGALLGGNIVNSGSGFISVNAQIVGIDFNNTGAGSIFYEITTRVGGTDSVGVFGKSAQGATGPWNISGYNYPFGGMPPSGYVMATDGANNLSFVSPTLSSFNLINTIYVASNGNDINSGTNIDSPVQTIQHAINLLEAIPASFGLIKILDSGTYTEALLFSGVSFIIVDGPGASIQFSASDTVTLTNTGSRYVITFNVWQINNFGGNNIFNIPGAQSSVFSYAQLYQSGNIYNEGGLILNGVALVFSTVTNTGTGEILFSIGNGISVTLLNSGTIGGFIDGLPVSQVYGNTNYNGALTVNNNLVFDSINVQTFTSSGTYTPTTGMSYCVVECVGSGGGGGGVDSAVGQSAAAGGGGGGAYAKSALSAATIGVSQAVTIGAGGAGGAAGNNNGSNGATSSLGALVSADGGSGGQGSSASATTPTFGIYGAGGGSGVGQLVKNGDSGFLGIAWGTSQIGIGGQGGNSFYGIGGEQLINLAGADGFNYGSGGGGASSGNTGNAAGGNGKDGVVIITEYLQV